MRVLLISTYEMGRQPFGLASPAAWLRTAGFDVDCLDLAVEKPSENCTQNAGLIAFYLPMHTATRIAARVIPAFRKINATAHFCAYGLYSSINAEFLSSLGVQTILGGEFEEGLRNLAARLSQSNSIVSENPQSEPLISLARQQFLAPDRTTLPALNKYAHLHMPDGTHRTVGYTEASRGCKHRCRHCPIVPVYDGKFRVIQQEVVLQDVAQQVRMGAEHITFGDPDFFNGTGHALPLVRRLHHEYPFLTYDVTIKVEHLLKHADALPTLRDTGCAFVTSAIESVDDRVLSILDKGHTKADFIEVLRLFREVRLNLVPTFVTFTPWLTLEGYEDLLLTLAMHGQVESVAPVQWAIRLLVPSGSLLLERPELRSALGEFDECALSYRWTHPDSRVDLLQREVESIVKRGTTEKCTRSEIFRQVWNLSQQFLESASEQFKPVPILQSRATVPFLTEPWFC